MKTIIGIDPGSRVTGYGLISYKGSNLRYIASGSIKTQQKSFFDRLRDIYDGVDLVLSEYTADICAVEGVIHGRKPKLRAQVRPGPRRSSSSGARSGNNYSRTQRASGQESVSWDRQRHQATSTVHGKESAAS